MKLYTVWTNRNTGISPWQKCVRNDNGDFVGVKSGDVYSKEDHYCSERVKAKIIAVDDFNLTGMYHLDVKDINGLQNRYNWKKQFIGSEVTLETAHMAGDHRIYRCRELEEYFSDTEIELQESDSEAW